MNGPFSSADDEITNLSAPIWQTGGLAQPAASIQPVRAVLEGRRFGFHYFPDTLHYREADLQTWLPELTGLDTAWLVLRSETDRAIPEHFLRGLKLAGIEPLIQFDLPLGQRTEPQELSTLLEVYARWGARYVLFFDRPNARSTWPAAGWAQQDLVERFLDRFLPLAYQALQVGLTPVLPPLEPGGSYWDTAFLRSMLQAIQRRKQEALLQNLVLSAYAWQGAAGQSTESRSLDWGAGGPERWPEARPYHTPRSSQDQRGFRIFDWYNAVARSVLHQDCQMILLQAVCPGDPRTLPGQAIQTLAQAESALAVMNLLAGETVQDPLDAANTLEAIPPQVIACNFWLLSASSASPFAGHAWFPPGVAESVTCQTGESDAPDLASQDRYTLSPAARLLRQWRLDHPYSRPLNRPPLSSSIDPTRPAAARLIRHYLLLPAFEWGIPDWYLEVIRPFVKKHQPTVGFSVEEALQAARVTVIGNPQHYPEDLFSRLQTSGCWFEQINGDGTKIASVLAER